MKGDDLLRQLREADPAPPQRLRGAARGAVARESLERILDGTAQEAPPRAPRRAPLGIAAVLATAVIAVAVVVMQQPPEVELPTVRVALLQAAETAERAEFPAPPLGQFLYSRTEAREPFTASGGEGTWTAWIPVLRESWIASDGSGRIREVPGDPVFPGPADRAGWRAAGKPRIQGRVSDRIVPPGTFAPAVEAEKATDAQRLSSALLATDVASDLPESQRLFVAASDLLSAPLASPTLRSALYRVLANLDQVELLGMVQDGAGRSGIAVGLPSHWIGVQARRVVIFDRETSAVLAEKVVVLERGDWIDADPPVVIESRVFAETAIVPSDHSRPAQ